MAAHRDEMTRDRTVVIDGNTHSGGTFMKRRIVFNVSGPFTLSANHFQDCSIALEGCAKQAVVGLSALFGGAWGAHIERLFERIRRGMSR